MLNKPKRKINRLQGYDYSQTGIYHITICSKSKSHLLSEIITDKSETNNNPRIILSDIGKSVDFAINKIPMVYPNTTIENYVIMPNHIHLLIAINNLSDGQLVIAPTISRMIKQLKSYVTKNIGYSIWQKGFYDHIIKDDEDLENVWTYINENPIKWENDEYFY